MGRADIGTAARVRSDAGLAELPRHATLRAMFDLTPELIARHGLTPDEYADIQRRLGRLPTFEELGVFSAMWSEHCAYKSSRIHFGLLPTTGPHVLLGPGENAGLVAIGPDRQGRQWAAAFKMESHNHPSFLEPVQGAATGVGGILRDVFTMGARPIAILNALRFGAPDHPRTRSLVAGVVQGVGGYGNCIGVPTVGGNCGFDACYDGNILVNAFALGVVPVDRVFKGAATGVGNPVIYVGSATGRDGLHGATMASAAFDATAKDQRPAVQVGDPFQEKLLLEACLELFAEDWLAGIQDMGAAGLTSSAFEMASRAGLGMSLNLNAVPMRAANLNAYELLLSESQERMLLVARRGCEDRVRAVCDKWGLESAVIGSVTDTGRMVCRFDGATVVDVPVAAVVDDAPSYDRPRRPPADLEERRRLDLSDLPDLADPGDLLALMAHPEIASKRWIWQQYDHTVRNGTKVGPGAADAAVIRVHENGARLALAVDCTERYGFADPWACGALAVAEAVRNLSCVGAEPLGLTDCLNFGNPEDPEVMWQLVEAMRGVGDAARALGAPVVSGNVSLYNATAGESILPTPMIAAVGRLPDGVQPVSSGFVSAGDEVWLLGSFRPSLGASRWLHQKRGRHAGRVAEVDLAAEAAVSALVRRLVGDGVARNAHDLSDGGLAVALAECAVAHADRPFAVACQLPEPAQSGGALRVTERLFGETGACVLIGALSGHTSLIAQLAAEAGVSSMRLGVVGTQGDEFVLGPLVVPLVALAKAHAQGFEQVVLGGESGGRQPPSQH